MLILRKAEIKEVPLLTDISKRAFDSDIEVGAPGPGGPGEYDNPLWHMKMLKEGRLFCYLEDDKIIGGALIWITPKYVYIGRIFIDPSLFNKGYGIKLMKAIEETYPRKEYQLDTPTWNIRTNKFYQKIGYKLINTKEDCNFYKKKATN